MSLSERLERARRQRMLDPDAVEMDVDPDGAEDDDWRPAIEIEVRPIGLHSVVKTGATSAASAARRCPACQSDGQIDLIDLVGQREHLTCVHCGAMWQISNAEPAELRD